jgi:hypothetical protein
MVMHVFFTSYMAKRPPPCHAHPYSLEQTGKIPIERLYFSCCGKLMLSVDNQPFDINITSQKLPVFFPRGKVRLPGRAPLVLPEDAKYCVSTHICDVKVKWKY